MGLFNFFSSQKQENGPCTQCRYKSGSFCTRLYKKKNYSRVSGTSYTYYSCEEARSSSGFCGHHGKYWEISNSSPAPYESSPSTDAESPDPWSVSNIK